MPARQPWKEEKSFLLAVVLPFPKLRHDRAKPGRKAFLFKSQLERVFSQCAPLADEKVPRGSSALGVSEVRGRLKIMPAWNRREDRVVRSATPVPRHLCRMPDKADVASPDPARRQL